MTEDVMNILRDILNIGKSAAKNKKTKRWDPSEIIDSIKDSGEGEVDEPCTCDAGVMCTMASWDSDPVHIVKEGESVQVEGLAELVKTDIVLAERFAGCMSEMVRDSESGKPGACTVSAEDIEGGEWMDHETERKANGEETLKLQTSYMFCKKGCALIYFANSGQEIREEWEMLEKYINEDAFHHASSNWNIETFKKVYGEDIFERMKRQMFDAYITEEASICAFIAAIGVESGWGRAILENTENKDFTKTIYSIETRGVGLMQITGPNQEDFITWIEENELEPDPDMLNKLLTLKAGYEGEYKVESQTKNIKTVIGKDGTPQNAAEFLAENYALEAAIWYWAYQKFDYFEDVNSQKKYSDKKITLNEFMVKYTQINSNADNVFLAVQLYVNDQGGWRNQRRQIIASTEDEDIYKVTETLPDGAAPDGEARREWYEKAPVLTEEEARKEQYKDDETKYSIYFIEDGVFHEGKISEAWGIRYHDWVKLKELW